MVAVARVTKSRCVFAHVRAASPGLPVTELNCHPFAYGSADFSSGVARKSIRGGAWGQAE